MDTESCERTVRLIGPEAAERLARAHVLVLGVGGVGAAAAEMLARAGVGKLTLVDGDKVEASNLNRQLVARRSTLGMFKTEAMKAQLQDICPELEIVTVSSYLTPENAASVLDPEPDFAVDAIDDVPAKTAFLLAAHARSIPLVSAMGAGGRTDPALVRECDIAATCQCGLARAVRTRLREHGVTHGIRVIFSSEPAVKAGSGAVGTISYMPNLFGCFCAAAALRRLISPEKNPQ